MTEPELAHCAAHPDAIAGWRCDAEGCGRALCGACTARTLNQFSCCTCGGTARQITIARTARPRAHWIVHALTYPFTKGLPAVMLVGFLLAAIAFGIHTATPDSHELDGIAAILRGAIAMIYVLVVVDASARGNQREGGTGLRLARAFVASLVVVVPGVASLYFLGAPARLDGLAILYLVLAATYLPLALAVAVTDVPFADAANPIRVFAHAWPLRRPYAGTLVAVVALAALAVQVAGATAKSAIPTPLVGDLVAVLPALVIVTILAHAIGLLPYVHGERLQWGAAEGYRDPAFPRMVASGQRKLGEVLTTEALTKNAGGGAGGGGATPEERNEARKVAELLKAENAARALRAYEARTWSAGAFDDRQLLALGKAAQRAKKPALAEALYAEGAAKDGRGQAQCLIAHAQLLVELGRSSEARAIYERVIATFPNSEPAKIAQRALE